MPILLLSFQKNSSWFYCTFLFFISIIFISSLIFIISIILWLWILFVLIFLILLGGQLGCLLEIFFLFLEEDILIWTSLLELLLLHPVDFVRLHSCILCLKVLTDFLFDVIIDPLIFFFFFLSSMLFSLHRINYQPHPPFFLWAWFLVYSILVKKDAWNNFCPLKSVETYTVS